MVRMFAFLFQYFKPGSMYRKILFSSIHPGNYDVTVTPDNAGPVYYNIGNQYYGMVKEPTTRSDIYL